MRTPIVLVSGSLGSGKTTLLRHLLEHADRRIAVLMNEFGEIDVDGRALAGEHVQIVELAGGCVCCSLVGEFELAVREILARATPDLIVVETTGVAEPDALVVDVEDALPEVRLDGVVVVVDADATVRFPQLGRITRTQIETADVVLVNKVDLVTETQAEQVEASLRGVAPGSLLLRTVRGRVDPALLVGPAPGTRRPARARRGAAQHDHEPAVDTFTYRSDATLDPTRFTAFADTLELPVYRAKGFVRLGDGGHLFSFVAGRWETEPFAGVAANELVFIGRGAAACRTGVLDRLRACETR